MSILARRSSFYIAAQLICHQLRPIAYSQHRNTEFKELPVICGRLRIIDTVWTAGQNDALGISRCESFQRSRVRENLAVHVALAHAASNQLLILSTKIENRNKFVHRVSFLR